jgi:hypothetical protein
MLEHRVRQTCVVNCEAGCSLYIRNRPYAHPFLGLRRFSRVKRLMGLVGRKNTNPTRTLGVSNGEC